MQRALITMAAAVVGLVPVCPAQVVPDPVNPLGAGQEGARLYEVSIFSGYATSAFPQGLGQATASGVGSDVNYGISADVGWQRHRDRGGFSIRYSGAYSGMVRYSDANGYSQSLAFGGDRKLSPKWSVSASASGQDSTLVQLLNQPSAISITSQLPSDFNDFAAAFGLGNFSTAQAASSILGAPVLQTPLQALLLGSKVLSYSGTGQLSYAYSRHLSFHAGGFASGGQSRAGSQSGIPQTNYVIPRTYGASAGANWSYSLSPRTDVGVNAEANRIQNHFQEVYTGTATASIGRKMGMHWFSRVYGGATYTEVAQQLTGSPKTRQIVGGGSLGIKTYADSLVASYDRSAADTFGSVVGTYTNFSGSWNHHHNGSRFSTTASFGQQQVRSTGFESFSGWQAGGSFSERLTTTTALHAQYVYFKSSGSFLGAPSSFAVHSVRLSMNWSPQPILR